MGIIYDGYVKASKLFHAQRARRILKKICCPNLSNGVGLFLSLFRGRTSSDRNIVRELVPDFVIVPEFNSSKVSSCLDIWFLS